MIVNALFSFSPPHLDRTHPAPVSSQNPSQISLTSSPPPRHSAVAAAAASTRRFSSHVFTAGAWGIVRSSSDTIMHTPILSLLQQLVTDIVYTPRSDAYCMLLRTCVYCH